MRSSVDSPIVKNLSRGRRLSLVGLAAALALALALGIALSGGSTTGGLLVALVGTVVVAACLLPPLFVAQDRGAWTAIALGIGLRVAGGVMLVGTIPPDPRDAGVWVALVGLLLLFVGIGLLVSRQLSEPSPSFWLDGLTAVLAIAAAVAAFIFDPLVGGHGASTASLALALALPLGDVILLAMIVGVYVLNRRRLGALRGALAIGLAVSLVGGLLVLWQVTSAEAATTAALTVVTGLGVIAIAIAAWHRSTPQLLERGQGVEMLVPGILFIATTAVLVIDHFRRLSAIAIVLAAAVAVAVVVRGMWTLRDLRSLAALTREALADDLTGLPNRRALYRSLDSATAIGRTSDRLVALLVFDLDRFKYVNDAFGHDVGDHLLRLVAQRLRSVTSGADVVARMGGDEFALLCETDSEAGAELVADRLLDAFDAPFNLDGAELHIDISIGIGLFPTQANDASGLLRCAELAMNRSQDARLRSALFSARLDEHGLERLAIINQFERGIESGELEPFYQPQVALPSGRLESVEALVRWRHPERGVLEPGEFLPVVWRTGAMRRLSRVMIGAAVEQAAVWVAAGRPLTVSVNLSPYELLDARIADDVAALLRRYELPPELLRIEITEEAAVEDLDRGIENLTRFQALGLSIALDDFGSGQSSLAYLKRMPVDELKIDRSFLLEYESDPRDAAIVAATVNLGHILGLRVVAEGVESAAAIALLTDLGCDSAQGFLISRPLSAPAFQEWRSRWSPRRLAGAL